MQEDRINQSQQRSWFDRLTHAFGNNVENKDIDGFLEQIREARKSKLLDPEAFTIIEGAISASSMQVREIMVPRSQMVCIKSDHTPERFLPRLIESGHSRFPVVGGNQDEVVGILLAKDLLSLLLQPQEPMELCKVLRPAVFIPESKRLNKLLNEFRTNRSHMAIVVDEYGGVSGLITIEDVLEQIVGNIEDETDVEADSHIRCINRKQFVVKALTPIDEFNEYFQTKFNDDEFDTIGGIVMKSFGHLPKRGEMTEINGFTFKVLNADSRRIRLLRILT